MNSWSIAQAKVQLGTLITRATVDGPQVITRYSQETVVVVSVQEWERTTARHGTLADFFAASPLPGSGVVIERSTDGPRQHTTRTTNRESDE